MGRDTAYWYRRGRGCLWAKAGALGPLGVPRIADGTIHPGLERRPAARNDRFLFFHAAQEGDTLNASTYQTLNAS